jgi:hypothetical protein
LSKSGGLTAFFEALAELKAQNSTSEAHQTILKEMAEDESSYYILWLQCMKKRKGLVATERDALAFGVVVAMGTGGQVKVRILASQFTNHPLQLLYSANPAPIPGHLPPTSQAPTQGRPLLGRQNAFGSVISWCILALDAE